MAKYKIAVIEHQLNNNKVAKYGDIVDEKQLNGNAKALEKKGFVIIEDPNQPIEEDTSSIDLSKLNKDDLLNYAKEHNYMIAPEDTKAQIIEAITEQKKDN